MITLDARTQVAADLPRQLYIEVTNRCNSLCASCPLTYDHFLPFATTDYEGIMLGNVFERPLAEVWNDEPYQDLRAAVLSKRPAPWPCQHCGVRWSL